MDITITLPESHATAIQWMLDHQYRAPKGQPVPTLTEFVQAENLARYAALVREQTARNVQDFLDVAKANKEWLPAPVAEAFEKVADVKVTASDRDATSRQADVSTNR